MSLSLILIGGGALLAGLGFGTALDNPLIGVLGLAAVVAGFGLAFRKKA
jgi:hypothetical protein